MQTNMTPQYDMSDNPTNCCPRFNPDSWDDQELHFDNKLFVKAITRSAFHIPLNMGKVFWAGNQFARAFYINQYVIQGQKPLVGR